MNTKIIKALVTFLTIARTFNCENHFVCDSMSNKLTIERVAELLNMDIDIFGNHIEILERFDLIVVSGRLQKHIILDPRLNCILQGLLTKNGECTTCDNRLFSRSSLRFAFHLILRTVTSLKFKNGTIVDNDGKALCKSEIAKKIRIGKDTLKVCFEQLAVLKIITIDKTKSRHYITINLYLFSELEKYIGE